MAARAEQRWVPLSGDGRDPHDQVDELRQVATSLRRAAREFQDEARRIEATALHLDQALRSRARVPA